MAFMTIQEASTKWDITARRIQVLCANGRLPGAIKFGRQWAIPSDLLKPSDARIRTGEYIKHSEVEKENLRMVDLFCGCGGMSLGFQMAGFNIISAYDKWEPAIRVYSRNFKHPVHFADLSLKSVQDEIVDLHPSIIIGGPPCQDFSTAGHMNENLGRAELSIVFSNIIVSAKPKYFVMENVANAKKSKAYSVAVENYRKAGYGLTQILLDASYCGVPQTRKRFFIIGELDGQDDFLQRPLEANLSEKPMSIYDYLGDTLGVEYYFRVPTNYSRRGIYSIYEPSQTIRGIDRPIPKGYKKHKDDPVDIGSKVRALTVLERSYIQTFPKTFRFEGTKTDLNTMIGNAVPVNLAKYVAEVLMEYIRKDI